MMSELVFTLFRGEIWALKSFKYLEIKFFSLAL